MFTNNIKRLSIILVIINFAMIFSLTYSISSNAEIRKSIEDSIYSNLIAVSQSITDIKGSEQTPNTSYAKESSIALLSNVSQYQVLNKKVSCFEFERLINGYRHLLYSIDGKGLDEVSKKKLDMISKYIDSFQKDEAIKLKDKFLNFNKVVSEDEEFVEIVRW